MIVLDTNSYPSVFNQNSSDHSNFCYILRWVTKQQNACFVYGGKKYKAEIRQMTTYLRLIDELKKAGKFVEIKEDLVDKDATRLKRICVDEKFDDEHIVAILNVSGCKLVCTKDTKAVPFIKNKEFYSDRKAPKIYSNAKHRHLLKAASLVDLKNKC